MPQENVEVVRRAIDAANRRDFGAMLAFYDPDVEFVPLRAATTGGIFEVRQERIVLWQGFGSKEKALEAVGLRD